jgi:hypothetical protein
LGAAGAGNGGSYVSATETAPTSALSNSGSGGGGAAGKVSRAGGNGGSGIVIIRYPANFDPPASVVGTLQGVQGSIANGYRVYIWTSSGTITF